jgi:hypothetical protein
VNASSSPEDDVWSAWLLHRRHADDPQYERAIEWAIERIGPTLHVLMTDISEPILWHAEQRAFQREVHRQCTFLHCDADKEKSCHSPIANYSERDLIRLAHTAGSDEMHLELHMDVIPSIVPNWQAFF